MTPLWQRLLALLGLLITAGGLCAAVYFIFLAPEQSSRSSPGGPGSDPSASAAYECKIPKPIGPKPDFFVGLPKPECVLVLSGQMQGYLQPCGCARPQMGGLERRFELIEGLRQRGWPVAALDLGDLAPKQADEQGRFKYEASLQMLQKMDYVATGMGSTEFKLPLDQALGIAQNYQPPFILAANFNDKDQLYPEMFRPWLVHQPKIKDKAAAIKLGCIGIIGDALANEVRKKEAALTIEPAEEGLKKALEQMEPKKPDLIVLLFQGSREEARTLLPKFPQIAVALTLDESDEPSAKAEQVGKSLVVSLGHKGKYVGVLGVFKASPAIEGAFQREPYQLQYELAGLNEHYELPDEKTNPAREVMREYVLRVQNNDLLAETKSPRTTHPLQLDFPEAKYAGAATCQECHPKAFAVWSKSRHSHAYEALVDCGRPIAQRSRDKEKLPPLRVGREFDPDCVRCHVTGFEYKTGFVNAEKSKHLLGNQCENCHGPASLHVANPKEKKYVEPLRLKAGTTVERNICRKCHDTDNDPHFDFDLYWPKVRHPEK